MPSPLTMPWRFSMSDLFIVRVSRVAAANTNTKNMKPMISLAKLEKLSSEIKK